VLVAADRDSGRAMGPWVDNLKSKCASNVRILGLLDLHTVFSLGRGIAKSRIRSETKDPLMLDFDGDTGKAYKVNGKNPVVVVIDKAGSIRTIASTTYSQKAFDGVMSAVSKALN
jgi:hypothetical protein